MTDKTKLAIAAVIGALISGPAQAQFQDQLMEEGTIVVGTTGSAPPFTMIGSDGELDGFDIAVMEKVAEDLGVEVEFRQLDWSGLLPGLVADRFDVVSSGVTRTADRLASDDLIMLSPYIINGVAVTKLTSNEEIQGWDDICGLAVGVVRGSAEIDLIRASLDEDCLGTVAEYPGWTELSLDLKNGRIDWIGMDYLGPNYLAANDEQITVLPEVRSPKTQSIAVSPNDPALAEAIEPLLAQYREDGTLNALIEQYFGQPVDFTQMPPDPS
ncbi:substrate-binding periplasmic protein [Pelagovum pacificum]|nr:ABC transporter substrate-binding protein [Pelagovum pacificum]QQA41979.1 amino acid ABC transporter substrate-binding protein [Pelagovum pacificum]